MLVDLKLDSDGIAEILKSAPMAAAVSAAAHQVAGNVNVDADDGVVVDTYTTDRAAASVTIRDAQGALWQARDGVLTKAAAAAGLEVTDES